MAEKRLNCGINKTVIMATKITVPDIGDFESVEIIEILTKPGDIIKKKDPIVTLESDKSSRGSVTFCRKNFFFKSEDRR